MNRLTFILIIITKKGVHSKMANPLILLVPGAGIEPARVQVPEGF